MNIFYTDHDPEIAARNLCKVHINKMIIESAQLLSTAHRILDGSNDEALYKRTHPNHPSSVWVRENDLHYIWLYEHMVSLMKLYTKYSGKIHSVETRCLMILSRIPHGIPIKRWSNPPFCATQEFRDHNVIVQDVKENYKSYLAWKYKEWQNREKPLKVEFVK